MARHVEELEEVFVVDAARAVFLPVFAEDAFGLVVVGGLLTVLVNVDVLGVEVGVGGRVRRCVSVALGGRVVR